MRPVFGSVDGASKKYGFALSGRALCLTYLRFRRNELQKHDPPIALQGRDAFVTVETLILRGDSTKRFPSTPSEGVHWTPSPELSVRKPACLRRRIPYTAAKSGPGLLLPRANGDLNSNIQRDHRRNVSANCRSGRSRCLQHRTVPAVVDSRCRRSHAATHQEETRLQSSRTSE